jgi:hypothetical protein
MFVGVPCVIFFIRVLGLRLSSSNQHATMIVIVASVAFLFWFLALRPRRGGKNAPPIVFNSSLIPIPFVGVMAEFFKGPHNMMKRCNEDYGPVFTIPVSRNSTESLILHSFLIYLFPIY